ncbi:hypothetical protein SUGI_0224780 [Cryptomeria japonica]|nr:hypothetical protein SUGI_0224780 [Cryptomeria japonica]
MKILPGLPDDIGRECLLRVPLTSHYKLARVCKIWKDNVYNPLFYQDRKRSGLSQKLIILPCSDERGCSYCVPFNHKLLIMGLLSDSPHFTNHKALVIYDFSSGKWKRGPDLPDRRNNPCCSLDSAKGLIYIAGGRHSDEGELRTAIVYDIQEEKWEYLPPMIWSGYNCHSVFTDDKLYVVSHAKGHLQTYDPNRRQWSAINMQPSFAAFERIYHNFHEPVIEWDYLENQILRDPELRSFIGATMWNRQILMAVVGKEEARFFYLFEPSIPGEAGKEDNWTLLRTFSETELPDVVTTIGVLTL